MALALPKVRVAVALALAAVGLALTGPLAASDGVIEINQVRALAGGVTPGDEPGFPVDITVPGSYLLTSNLDVRDEAAPLDAIAIRFQSGSEGANLDLNGFSLLGARTGCGQPSECPAPSGTGHGIVVAANFVSVEHGAVRGFAQNGVNASTVRGGILRNLVVTENGGDGIRTQGHVVRDCESSYNAGRGFDAVNATIEGCRAVGNFQQGFNLANSRATGCVATANGLGGIYLQYSILRESTSMGNLAQSVVCGSGSLLGGNSLGGFQGSCTQGEPNLCGGAPCADP